MILVAQKHLSVFLSHFFVACPIALFKSRCSDLNKKADTRKCGGSHPGRHSYGLGPAG